MSNATIDFTEIKDWNDHAECNDHFRKLFLMFRKDPNFPYEKTFNEIAVRYPKEVQKNFGYRKDGRTFGQFAIKMFDEHLTERLLAEKWLNAFAKRHYGEIKAQSVGIDDTGCVVMPSSGMERPDYFLKPIDQYLEFKTDPCDWKYSFKVDNLQGYSKYASAMAVICSKGKFLDGSNVISYCLFSPEEIDTILKQEYAFYAGRGETGRKKSIQFYANRSPEVVAALKEEGKLHESALPLVEFCKEIHPIEVEQFWDGKLSWRWK